jgi:hypothetical protein
MQVSGVGVHYYVVLGSVMQSAVCAAEWCKQQQQLLCAPSALLFRVERLFPDLTTDAGEPHLEY